MKPRLFIGSSSEGIAIANAIHLNLQSDAEVTVWNQGVFDLSLTSSESLIAELEESDFSTFVFTPDDVANIRGQDFQVARDNVIFELGLFIGRLGRERCYIVVPDNDRDLHIPTDLIGITIAPYETDRSDKNWQAATGPACTKIREAIGRLGGISESKRDSGGSQRIADVLLETDSAHKTDLESNQLLEERVSEDDYAWIAAFLKSELQEALELLEKHISKVDDDLNLMVGLECWVGKVNYRLDPSEGTAILESLMEKYPGHSRPYHFLAREYLERGLNDLCGETVDRGIEKFPNDSNLVIVKVEHLKAIGRNIDVIETLISSTNQNPQSSELYKALTDEYIEQELFEDARSWLEKGLSHTAGDEDLLGAYARLLYDHFDKKLAIIPYGWLLHLKPGDPWSLAMRANIYLDLGLNDLAMRDYKRANESVEGKQAWIVSNIGNLFKNVGLFREGIHYLQQALEIEPNSEYAHEKLAIAMKSRDEQEKELADVLKDALQTLGSGEVQPQN